MIACGPQADESRWTVEPENPTPISRHEGSRPYGVMFYNCGNLFDASNAPGKADDAFTPDGAYEWSRERYLNKSERLAEVIGDLARPEPALIGLCEVENAKVLRQLLKQAPMEGSDHGLIHYESRDPRGIDLALLYDEKRFRRYERKAYPIDNPGSGTPSRPVLSIGLESANKDSLRVFLCHWPSRAGGKADSEASRMHASKVLRDALSDLYQEAPSRKVLIMGDMNDHPDDPSVQALTRNGKGFEFRDLMADAHRKGKGTYHFRGKWGVLDHFLINEALRNPSSGMGYRRGSARILRIEKLLFYDRQEEAYRPDRFMHEGRYFGGYSDHLPILMELGVMGRRPS